MFFLNQRRLFNSRLWFYLTNVSSYVKALCSSIYICRLSFNFQKAIFMPDLYIKDRCKKFDTVLIYGGSYNLIDHVNQNISAFSGPTFTLAVNTSVMSGLPVDLAFWELWNKTSITDWFEKSFVSSGRFSQYTSNCKCIVLTRILPSLLPTRLLELGFSNIYLSLDRSLHVSKFFTSSSSVVRQISKYLYSSTNSPFWSMFLPTLRGSLVRAILFSFKLKPKRIIICGMSQGQKSLHWFDRHDMYPHLKDYSDVYRFYANPSLQAHRTNDPSLGTWTINSLLQLISSNSRSIELFVATTSGIVPLNKDFDSSLLDPF